MSTSHIPMALRCAIVTRAENLCEYCRIPDDVPLAAHEADHVIAERHGGATESSNLAYACFRCNRLKGSDLSSIDPQTGEITRLFNPRGDLWSEHFRLDAALIVPLTAIGRTTVQFLDCNDAEWQALRAELLRQGRFTVPAR